MKIKTLVIIFLLFSSVSIYADLNNIEIKKLDSLNTINNICQTENNKNDCYIKYYYNPIKELEEDTAQKFFYYFFTFLLLGLLFLLFIESKETENEIASILLIVIFLIVMWYEYNDSISKKTSTISNFHDMSMEIQAIQNYQNKQNQLFYNKLKSDTETLSSIVDVLSESNRKNRNNSKTFKRLIEKLDANIQENTREMENIKELTPTAKGTTIKIR